MTVDEMQVFISASAEDALATMDAVILKIEQLTQLADGKGAGMDVKLNAAPATDDLDRLIQQAGLARTELQNAAASAETVADPVQKALDWTEPLAKTEDALADVTDGLAAVEPAAKAAGDAVSKKFGEAASEALTDTAGKIGTKLLTGLVTGGTTAIMTLLMSGLGSLVSALINAKANAEAAAAALRKEHQEAADALEDERKGLDALAAEYDELAGKSSRTLTEETRMYAIQQQLRSEYGITSNSVLGLAGSYDSLRDAIKAAQEAQASQSTEALSAVAMDAGNVALGNAEREYQKLADLRQQYEDSLKPKNRSDFDAGGLSTDELSEQVSQQEKALAAQSGDFVAWFTALTAKNAAEVKAAGQTWNDELTTALVGAFQIDLGTFDTADDAKAYVLAAANAVMAAVRSPEVNDAMTAADQFHAKVAAGFEPTEAEYDEISQSYDVLRTNITAALTTLYGGVPDASQVTALLSALGIPEAVPQSWEEYNKAVEETNLRDLAAQADTLSISLQGLSKSAGDQTYVTDNIRAWQSAYDAYKNAAAGSREAQDAYARMQTTAAALGYTLSANGDKEAMMTFLKEIAL